MTVATRIIRFIRSWLTPSVAGALIAFALVLTTGILRGCGSS